MVEQFLSDVKIELNYLDKTSDDIICLINKTEEREINIYDTAAGSMLISQLYNGIENILKQILKFEKIPLPFGANSHIELFLMFTDERTIENLPILFTNDIINGFSILRRFRHFTRHGYAYDIDWDRLKLGMKTVEELYNKFKTNLNSYLQTKQL
ncbi:MAG: hypothetical protein V1779_04190 [bacterium]